MTNNTRFKKKLLSQVITASLLSGAGVGALADEFSLVDNQLTWSNSGSSGTVTVANTGVASTATLATPSTNAQLPNLTFTLSNTSTTITGDYYVQLLLRVTNPNDANDIIEMTVGTAKVTLNAGSITNVSMVTSGQPNYTPVIVYARQGSANNQVTNLNSQFNTRSDMITYSGGTGGTTTIQVDNVISALVGTNQIFDAVLDEFKLVGNYDYYVGVKHLAGPENFAEIGTVSSGNWTKSPLLAPTLTLIGNNFDTAGTTFFRGTLNIQNNTAPTASATSITTDFETASSGTLPAATDAQSNTITYAISTQAGNGTATVTNSSTGAYTYTPNTGFSGSDSFVYSVTDSLGASNTYTVSVTVNAAPNAAPVANNGTASVAFGGTVNGTLTATDSDTGDTLTYRAGGTTPTKGNVTFDGDSFTYTATVGAANTGTDTFSFIVNDGTVDSNEATVTVTIADNQAPTATGGAVSVGVAGSTFSGSVSGTDPDNNPLTYALEGTAPAGLTFNTDGTYTYTSSAAGSVSFQFTASDSVATSAPATVTLTATAANTAPSGGTITATSPVVDSDGVAGEDVTVTASGWVDDNDTTLTYAFSAGNQFQSGTSNSATFRLPDGDSTVQVTVADSAGLSGSASTTVTVGAPTPPTATIAGDAVRTVVDTDGDPGQTVALSGTVADADGTVSSAEWRVTRTDGQNQTFAATVGSGGAVSNTLSLLDGFNDITLVATDNVGLSTTSSPVQVRVGRPTSPIVTLLTGNTIVSDVDEVAGETVSLSANLRDPDGKVASATWFGTLAGGERRTLATVANPATPLVSSVRLPENGKWSIELEATDNTTKGLKTTSTPIEVEVRPPVPPTVQLAAQGQTIVVPADGSGSITATATSADPRTISYLFSLNGGEPIAAQSGTTTFSDLTPGDYVVSARATTATGLSSSTPASANYKIVRNQAPTVEFVDFATGAATSSITIRTSSGGGGVQLLPRVSDPDGQIVSGEWSTTVQNVNENGQFTYDNVTEPTTATVTLVVTDNIGDSTTATVDINLIPLASSTLNVSDITPDADGNVTLGTGETSVTGTFTVSFGSGAAVPATTENQWLINGVVVEDATGTATSAELTLPAGRNVVTVRSNVGAVGDENGFVESSTVINVIDPAVNNQEPTISITGGDRSVVDTTGISGEQVSFSAVATDPDDDGSIAEIQWTVNGQQRQQTGANVTLGLAAGTNTVSAVAIDNLGGRSEPATVTVTVGAPVLPSITIVGGSRTVLDTDGKAGEQVPVTATVTDQYGTVTTGQWFVNGAFAAEGLSAVLPIATDGAAEVAFRATNSVRLQNAAGVNLTVAAPVAPTVSIIGGGLTLTDSDSQPGEVVQLAALADDADGEIASVEWSVGGQIVAQSAAEEVRLPDGLNTVVVTVTDSQGLTATAQTTVEIAAYEPPPTEDEVNNIAQQQQQQTQQLNNDQLTPQQRETLARQAAEEAARAAEALRRGVATGSASNSALLQGLNATSGTAAAASNAGRQATSQENRDAINSQSRNLLNSGAQLISQVADNAANSGVLLSQQEEEQLQQATSAILSTTATLAETVEDTEELLEIARASSNIAESNKRLGIPASAEDVEKAKTASVTIATKFVEKVLADLGQTGANVEEIRNVLATNDNALQAVISSAVSIPPVNAKSQAQRSNELTGQLGNNANPSLVQRLAASTGNVTNPADVVVEGRSALDIIRALFGGQTPSFLIANDGRILSMTMLEEGEARIEVDDVTGLVQVILPGETYSGAIVAIKAVPDTVPEGIRFRQNGTGLIVNDGLAIEIAPAPINMINFAAAVEGAGFPFTFRPNASVSLDVGNGERFSGVFGYDNLTGIELNTCGALSFSDPQGPLNSAGYAFSVQCANGAKQRILPFIESTTFVDSVGAFGLRVTTDRSTGFVTVETVGTFKPNFFVTPRTSAERVFHAANRDRFGNAYQTLDANGDGLMDIKLISNNGTQILFGVQ